MISIQSWSPHPWDVGEGVGWWQEGNKELRRKVQHADASPSTNRAGGQAHTGGRSPRSGGKRMSDPGSIGRTVHPKARQGQLAYQGFPSLNIAPIVDIFLKHCKSFLYSFIDSVNTRVGPGRVSGHALSSEKTDRSVLVPAEDPFSWGRRGRSSRLGDGD